MPALNGTGPMGRGPMTGRGLGNCLDTARPKYLYPLAWIMAGVAWYMWFQEKKKQEERKR